MTDLQMGLFGLGGAAVVAVLAYNKWQEYRHRKVAEQVMKSDHQDILLEQAAVERRRQAEVQPAELDDDDDMPWREPTLGESDTEDQAETPEPPNQASGLAAALKEAPQRQEPQAVDETAQAKLEAAEVEAREVPRSLLDPRVDFIVVMELVEAVPAPQIFESQKDALARISKPVLWVGFNDKQREWEIIQTDSDRAYRRLRIGLQLADRRGPLSEMDLNIFVVAMHQLADELLAVADMSPHQGVIGLAVDIDGFCADVDLQIGVHLISKGTPFAGTKIRALAEAAGMVLGDDGFFTKRDDDGNELFKLQNYETTLFSPDSIKSLTTHGITFMLDVPRVVHGERVFFLMVDQARRFADALQGQLVDDNRQPLHEAQLDGIKREYVAKTQANMAQYGLPAGSPQALRLFS
ncbi:MAG: putative ZipA related protein involved in cell division [Proteobacteria bacterium]|nr:putative ZipA related protein involved in cell division [Pseudomonadota bacterium]